MKTATLIAFLLAVLFIPVTIFAQAIPTPNPGTPAWPWWHAWNPYNSNYPYPNTNPYRRAADAATYGQVVSYIEVPPQQVVVNVYVPGPGSLSGGFEPQLFEIPGYVVTETTTGYVYPARVGLREVTPGVFNWVTEPPGFQPR